MTCRLVMNTDVPALHPTDSVERAAALIIEHRLPALPVVDAQGRYLGLLGICRALSLLLPRAILLDGGVTDLAYMSETLPDLQQRYQGIRSRQVGECMDTHATVIGPDTPLMETLLFLYRSQNIVPVVDKDSGRLLGVVSSFGTLSTIAGGL
jgi:CBS-domain-containing membrane protein